MLERLKSKFKSNAETPPPAQGQVDIFNLTGKLLEVKGWIYDESAKNVRTILSVESESGKQVFSCVLNSDVRIDVACALNNSNAVFCGFHSFFEIDTPFPLVVKIKLLSSADSETESADSTHGTSSEVVVKELVAGNIEPNVPSSDQLRITELNQRLKELAQKGFLDPEAPIKNAAESYWQSMVKDIPTALILQMQDESTPALVILAHSLGGGAAIVLQETRDVAMEAGKRVFMIRFDAQSSEYTCEGVIGGNSIKGSFHALEEILDNISNIEEVLVGEIADYRNIPELLSYIVSFAQSKDNVTLSCMLSNFISVCASINLLNYEGRFCGLPADPQCRKCFDVVKGAGLVDASVSGRDEYRASWRRFLEACNVIYAFSENTKGIVESVYPELIAKKSIVVQEPPCKHLPKKVQRSNRKTEDLVVGILGVQHPIKGQEVVSRLATLAEEPDSNFNVRIIGYCPDNDPKLTKLATGRYDPQDLDAIVQDEDIDIFFISSICPETYSLTVSEIMAMDEPFACFDIGAPADRARAYEKGFTIPYDSTPEQIIESLRSFAFDTLELDKLPLDRSA